MFSILLLATQLLAAEERKCNFQRNENNPGMTESSCLDGGFPDEIESLMELPKNHTHYRGSDGVQLLYMIFETAPETSGATIMIDLTNKMNTFATEKNKNFEQESQPQMQVGVIDCRAAKYSEKNTKNAAAKQELAKKEGAVEGAEFDASQKEAFDKLDAHCATHFKEDRFYAQLGQLYISGCGGEEKVNVSLEKGSEVRLEQKWQNYHAQYCQEIKTVPAGMPGWQIAIIVITVLLFLGMLCALVWFVVKRKSSGNRGVQEEKYSDDDSDRDALDDQSYGSNDDMSQGRSVANMSRNMSQDMNGRQ